MAPTEKHMIILYHFPVIPEPTEVCNKNIRNTGAVEALSCLDCNSFCDSCGKSLRYQPHIVHQYRL